MLNDERLIMLNDGWHLIYVPNAGEEVRMVSDGRVITERSGRIPVDICQMWGWKFTPVHILTHEEYAALAQHDGEMRVEPAAAPVPTPEWVPMHPDDADLLRRNIPAIASLYNQGYEIARRIQRQGSEGGGR